MLHTLRIRADWCSELEWNAGERSLDSGMGRSITGTAVEMAMHTVFSEPAFADARALLLKSRTGADIVAQLERLPTRTHVLAPSEQTNVYGDYNAVRNLYEAHVAPHHDQSEVALTLGHEGVHRIRRGNILIATLTQPLFSLPDAVIGAAAAARQGKNVLAAAVYRVDTRSMREELIAFQTEGRIAQELKLDPQMTQALNDDGSAVTEPELLKRLAAGYRTQIWTGRGLAVGAPAAIGYATWKQTGSS